MHAKENELSGLQGPLGFALVIDRSWWFGIAGSVKNFLASTLYYELRNRCPGLLASNLAGCYSLPEY